MDGPFGKRMLSFPLEPAPAVSCNTGEHGSTLFTTTQFLPDAQQ